MHDDVDSGGTGGKPAGRGPRRRRLLGVVLAAVALTGVAMLLRSSRHGRPYQALPLAYEGDSSGLQQTVIVPTLDTPMPPGRNVIWCSSFQVAWNHLRDDVVKAPVQLANAQPVADRLNQAPQSEADLPGDSYCAAAGSVADGIIGTIRKDMAAKFPAVPLPSFDSAAGDAIIAYAYLRAGVKFTIPFFDSHEPLRFLSSSGGESRLSAFGIRPEDEYAYSKLRGKVGVLYEGELSSGGALPKDMTREELLASKDRAFEEWQQYVEQRGGLYVPPEFVIDPCTNSSPVQILLATVAAKATLAETLSELARKIHAWTPEAPEHQRAFGANDVLLVPNVSYKVRHRFSELEGPDKVLLNPGFRGWMQEAFQSVEFKLDRSGAELASQAGDVVELLPRCFVFDRPFLIVMTKRGAAHPFFVMWVDNAELLCKWQGVADALAFPPPSKEQTAPR